MSSSAHQTASRHRNASMSSSGRSSRKGQVAAEPKDFTSPTSLMRYFEPTAATASMFLYAQGSSVVVSHHDSLTIERRFSRHSAEVQLLAVDTQSEIGAGRLVVSYDVDMTAIVWDLMTGDEVARFASYENLTCAAWMRNGNVAFGNTQGNVILFEPTTSEHISARTIDQIPITALAPAADCRTFAIGYQNGSLLIATLQPRFTILHNLSTSRAPSPIVNLAWHASSARQKSDMLAVQTNDGDLRVWSVAKSFNSDDPAKVVRILKRTDNYQNGPNWMGWSKNGRIIQYSEGETLSWDVRTKHVTWDSIPTLEHVRGLAVYGAGATLFTLGATNTVQQFDLNTPSLMVANVQHPANLLPPSPPVSIEEQPEQGVVIIGTESDSSVPISTEVSESDDDHLSPLARLARGAEPSEDSFDQDRYMAASPVSSRSRASSTVSKSSTNSKARGQYPPSVMSRGMTENTYISTGSSLRSSAMPPYGDKDAYSIGSVSSASVSSSTRSSRHRPSRLRNEVLRSPEDNKVADLFQFTRSRLHDVPYKRLPLTDQSRLTNDDLRRQMLSVIFGWNREIQDLVRDEMARHPSGSPSRILLAKWLGDIDADVMSATSENMTSSDWMLLALSGIGGTASQHKLGRAYVQRLLENGDVHAAATIMIGMGDQNDAIEIYISHRKYMEALILLCLFFPNVWERQSQVIKKWGEFAIQHGQQQLAIRCFACTGVESSEPWTSPSAAQVTFQSLNQTIPEILSPPLSPPGINLGPQRNLAKSSALKLITSFGDKGKKAKFFAAGDGGATPIAAGVTPIAESAVSPGGNDPSTAFLRPSQRSAFNTPSSAIPPVGFNRKRLPSIGEIPLDNRPRDLLTGSDLLTPPTDAVPDMNRTQHSRKTSNEQYSAGLSVGRSATASPQMMRDNHRLKDPPPPSPSPESLYALMQQGRSSRNGARDRMPSGMELRLDQMDPGMNGDITSPEQSVASSTRFHWPSRRRGPGSVASSVTSHSSAGRGFRSATVGAGGRNMTDYISSLDTAQHYSKKGRSRESSRQRTDDGVGRGRDESRSRRGGARETSEDRGRSIAREWTPKPAKRSPTSPVPMSPEDLINLSTPSQPDTDSNEEAIVPINIERRDPSTARKASQIRRTSPNARVSSRASSRRRRSLERRPPALALDTRGRSENRGDGSLMRSPSSPLPMSAQAHFYASDDDEDYRAALEAQEQFRNRHNRSGSTKDPSSPAVGRRRDRSESRRRRVKTPALPEQEPPMPIPTPIPTPIVKERSTSRAGDLKKMMAERQAKKEAAARELEERRKSLARRPSAPPIPHPDELSPIVSRPPSAFELPQTTFVQPKDMPIRSHTADHIRGSYMRNGNRPVIGLPATPKAMRLKFESHDRNIPQVPALPTSAKTSPSSLSSAQPSPNKSININNYNNNKSAESSPTKLPENNNYNSNDAPSLLTLLPSTVYSPPMRPSIDRCMSAPIPEEPHHQSRGSIGLPAHPGFQMNNNNNSRGAAGAVPRRGSVSRKMSADAAAGMGMRGIDEMLGMTHQQRQQQQQQQQQQQHSRRSSRDDQIPPPPPPPPPPVLKELQHLATPPPPPPAPLPGMRLSNGSSNSGGSGSGSGSGGNIVSATPGGGTIEIVMDDDDQQPQNSNAPAAAPMSEAIVPIIAPPAPPAARNGGGGSGSGHARGRSITEGSSSSIAGRISRATERLRSASRGRNNNSSVLGRGTKSPDQTSPYESLPPVSYNNNGQHIAIQQQQQQQQQQQLQQMQLQLQQQQQNIERHPREVRAAYQQQQQQQKQREFGTGLLESEMI